MLIGVQGAVLLLCFLSLGSCIKEHRRWSTWFLLNLCSIKYTLAFVSCTYCRLQQSMLRNVVRISYADSRQKSLKSHPSSLHA